MDSILLTTFTIHIYWKERDLFLWIRHLPNFNDIDGERFLINFVPYNNRSNRTGELFFDPKIEKTTRSLNNKEKLKKVTGSTSRIAIEGSFIVEDAKKLRSNGWGKNTSRIGYCPIDKAPLCINYLTLQVDFELKPGLM